MKKILSVLLCALMLLGVTAICASAEGATVTLTVASDLHYNFAASGAPELSKRNNVSADYYHVSVAGDLPAESFAVITAFLEKAADNESDYLLITGDLVDNGLKEGHEALALMLKDFEAKSGKSVYVVPGNHDFYGVTPAEFEAIYADFGYGEAIAKDSLSKSYTVDLKGNYRLLLIDSTKEGESADGMTVERVNWVKAQCEKAKADGKYLIAAMHHNLLEHVSASELSHGSNYVDSALNLAGFLSDGGVKYVFVGHSHNQDISGYKSNAGNEIYEVITGSLTSYPVPYRVVSFGTQTNFETRHIDKIDISLVPEGMSATAAKVMNEDFLGYSRKCYELGINILAQNYLTASALKNQLAVDRTKNPEVAAIVDKIVDRMAEALAMPLYMRDEVIKGESIQRILAAYDVLLPETDCATMAELAALFYIASTAGDEDYRIYSEEVFAFTRGMAAVLNYGMENVTGEEYAAMMSYMSGISGVTIHEGFLYYAGNGVSRFKGIETYIATAVTPVVAEFTDDEAPADNNAVLSGYEPKPAAEEKEKTFWEKIADFFKKIYDYLMDIFTYYDDK